MLNLRHTTKQHHKCELKHHNVQIEIAQSLPTLESVLKLASHLENTHYIS
jgi:hypothetical protein